MQAELEVNKTGKPKSFYRTYLRPALLQLLQPRRKSFWNVSLEDEMEPPAGAAASVVASVWRTVVGSVMLMLGQALLILLPALYLVQLVFVVPDGLPGVIGRQLADVCLRGGSCNIQILLASYGFAVIMLINIVGLLGYSLLSATGYFDQAHADDEVLGLAVIDQRIRTLHDELVTAGVLKATVESDDDPD